MADEKKKKKVDVFKAFKGGSNETSVKVKTMIVAIFFFFAIIFFVIPFLIGMGFQGIISNFNAGSIVGLIFAIAVIYIGGVHESDKESES